MKKILDLRTKKYKEKDLFENHNKRPLLLTTPRYMASDSYSQYINTNNRFNWLLQEENMPQF